MSRQPRDIHNRLISVVLPVYNESAVLEQLVEYISAALSKTACRFEFVFVNDGSTDGSSQKLDHLAEQNENIQVVHFSRNFGHQAAVHAGLLHAQGDAIILMDSDLQDDPACLPRFVEAWQSGHDVVYAIRTDRKENAIKRFLFYSFYRVLNQLVASPLPMDAGNFSLLDRRVAQEICRLSESDRYFPGLRNWVGFRQTGITVERLARHDDHPRVTVWQLFRLAKTAIFGFSSVPLSVFYFIGAASLLVCLGTCAFCLYHKIVTGLAIPGWTSITISASFFGSLNAMGIAILGEYVARIYDQVRQRPQFVVARNVRSGKSQTEASDGQEREILHSIESLQNSTGLIFDAAPQASSQIVQEN